MAPITPLNRNRMQKRQGAGFHPRQIPAKTNDPKLARFTDACSRTKYLPRIEPGTNDEIHGSHPALEMPRERLKANNRMRIRARRFAPFRNCEVIGPSAMTKMNIARIPQPP